MGLRSRLKNKIQSIQDRLSGEYSAAAPDEITPYERPGVPQENVQVVKAHIPRPGSSAEKKKGFESD